MVWPVVSTASTSRPLRILFVVQPGALLRFALLIPALAERGHAIHIAFPPGGDWEKRHRQQRRKAQSTLPQRTLDLLNEFQERFPHLTWGPAAIRKPGGWATVAWLVRGLADLAHSADPRYKRAGVLRQRTKKRVLGRMEKKGQFEPLASRLAARRGRQLAGTRPNARRSAETLRLTALLEEAIPTSRAVNRFVRGLSPDVVVTTGTFRHVSSEVEFLKSARRLRIPAAIFVTSWDNLTNKGSLKFVPERVFVWNEMQARDAVELHRIPRDRVRLTGAHVFDEWFERRPTRTREELLTEVGLDPARPYLVYLCSSGTIARNDEPQFIERWIAALRSSDAERLRSIGVLVRPHPNVRTKPGDPGFENAVVWPPQGAYPVAAKARADFFDTLSHCEAVVGMNTTAMIEAAIVGKSVLTILVPEFAQETTLHFNYLLNENGGFLHVAKDLDEHIAQLGHVLEEDAEGQARRRQFVESFVRPLGMERPAAPLGAQAIEEVAGLRVRRRIRPAVLALRLGLSLEAGLSAVYERVQGTRVLPSRERRLVLGPSEAPR
jgi:hypothetical protein